MYSRAHAVQLSERSEERGGVSRRAVLVYAGIYVEQPQNIQNRLFKALGNILVFVCLAVKPLCHAVQLPSELSEQHAFSLLFNILLSEILRITRDKGFQHAQVFLRELAPHVLLLISVLRSDIFLLGFLQPPFIRLFLCVIQSLLFRFNGFPLLYKRCGMCAAQVLCFCGVFALRRRRFGRQLIRHFKRRALNALDLTVKVLIHKLRLLEFYHVGKPLPSLDIKRSFTVREKVVDRAQGVAGAEHLRECIEYVVHVYRFLILVLVLF